MRQSTYFILFLISIVLLPLRGYCQATTSDAGYATLTEACDKAKGGTLLLTKVWMNLPNGTKLACNITAKAGGKLQPAPKATVMLMGSFDGDLTQHFDLQEGSTVSGPGISGATLAPQWWGARGDGITLRGCSISSGSTTAVCPQGQFSASDKGKYISISGAGEGGSGLGSSIGSVVDSTHVTVAAAALTTAQGNAVVTYGTNDYPAIAALASAASANNPHAIVFPPKMYIIGQHKSISSLPTSCVNSANDIQWNNLTGTTISGKGAIIYIDASFYQQADCSGVAGKSAENTITPFELQHVTGVSIEGFSILGNKDLIRRASSVKTESLTSFCVSVGGAAANKDYHLSDLTCEQPETDCYFFGRNYDATDQNATGSNLICREPARGSFSVGNINGLHLSAVHGSDAGAGPYGGFQPFHCVDIEPNLNTTDNIVFDKGSSCSNDIGWEFTVSDASKVGHVTVRDSSFSWSNTTKQQGFNVNSRYSEILNNKFVIAHSASANNVRAIGYTPWAPNKAYNVSGIVLDPSGHEQRCVIAGTSSAKPDWKDNGGKTVDGTVTWVDLGPGVISQLWQGNTFIDSTGASGNPLFSSGYAAVGSPNPLKITGNTFRLHGLSVNARNSQEFSGNHIYWVATGQERAASTIIVDLQGSRDVHDNDYATDLKTPGAYLEVRHGTAVATHDQYQNPVIRPAQ